MRRKNFSRPRRSRYILRAVGLLLVFLLLFMVVTDNLVRPVLLGYAKNLAEIEATKVINSSIEKVLLENGFDYGDYVEIMKDDTGNIIAVSADAVKLNVLISKMVLDVQQDISQKGKINFKIPIGSITGSAYLIGRGPDIPMGVRVSTAVKHTVTSEFSDAGVNQTLHRMVLHISTSAFVTVPFYTSSTTAEVQVPLAETVIVGKVPDAYTVVIESDNSDLAGDLFDFGADTTN